MVTKKIFRSKILQLLLLTTTLIYPIESTPSPKISMQDANMILLARTEPISIFGPDPTGAMNSDNGHSYMDANF